MYTIYQATSPSNKVYVGITSKTLARRKTQHFSAAKAGSDYAFHRAIRKYGDAIEWKIVTQVTSLEEATSLEKSLIQQTDSFGLSGYNQTSGGEGHSGVVFSHSDDAKKKISTNNAKFWTGKTRSEETKKKLSVAQLGKSRGSMSEKHKAKLRVSKIGLKNPQSKGGVVTPYGWFSSTKVAAEELNLGLETIKRRCRSNSLKFDSWKYGSAK